MAPASRPARPGSGRRRRLRLGPRAGGKPRVRLRALRRADPRRRDHGVRGAGLHSRAPGGGARLQRRQRGRALRADDRRPAAHLAARAPQRRLPAGDGRRDGGGGAADGGGAGRQLREPHRGGSAGGAREPVEEPGGIGCRERPPGRSARGRREPRAGRRLAPGEGPRRARRRAGDTGHAAVVQHRGRAAAHAPLAARPGRADRLLDLLLHQLHPDPARAPGLGRPLSPRRAHDHRRPRAGVPVRARRRQRRAGDRAQPACATRSPRTTTSSPGARTGTSTGRPSTSSTRAGGCATCTSARATTT